MANLRGAGKMSKRNLIVDFYKKNAVVDKETNEIKGYYVDAQIDQSLLNPEKVREGEVGKQAPDSNPHLNSRERESLDGKGQYVDHRFYVAKTALDKMWEASDKKNFIENKGTENERIVMGINADLFVNKDKQVVINTAKEMGPTTNPQFGKTVLDKQAAVTEAKKSFNTAQKANKEMENQVEAKEEVAEAQNEGAEADVPF